jgi:hypothetical protein
MESNNNLMHLKRYLHLWLADKLESIEYRHPVLVLLLNERIDTRRVQQDLWQYFRVKPLVTVEQKVYNDLKLKLWSQVNIQVEFLMDGYGIITGTCVYS